MAANPSQAPEILLPAKAGFIVITLALALTLNLLPLKGVILWLRPDFAALVLLYWNIHQPRRVGIGIAWAVGLMMDVADASLFGQHALAYSLMAYGSIFLHRRILMFGLWPQVLHVLPFLLGVQLIMLLVRLSAGAEFAGWAYFLGAATGALLWPAICIVLHLLQRPKPDSENI